MSDAEVGIEAANSPLSIPKMNDLLRQLVLFIFVANLFWLLMLSYSLAPTPAEASRWAHGLEGRRIGGMLELWFRWLTLFHPTERTGSGLLGMWLVGLRLPQLGIGVFALWQLLKLSKLHFGEEGALLSMTMSLLTPIWLRGLVTLQPGILVSVLAMTLLSTAQQTMDGSRRQWLSQGLGIWGPALLIGVWCTKMPGALWALVIFLGSAVFSGRRYYRIKSSELLALSGVGLGIVLEGLLSKGMVFNHWLASARENFPVGFGGQVFQRGQWPASYLPSFCLAYAPSILWVLLALALVRPSKINWKSLPSLALWFGLVVAMTSLPVSFFRSTEPRVLAIFPLLFLLSAYSGRRSVLIAIRWLETRFSWSLKAQRGALATALGVVLIASQPQLLISASASFSMLIGGSRSVQQTRLFTLTEPTQWTAAFQYAREHQLSLCSQLVDQSYFRNLERLGVVKSPKNSRSERRCESFIESGAVNRGTVLHTGKRGSTVLWTMTSH